MATTTPPILGLSMGYGVSQTDPDLSEVVAAADIIVLRGRGWQNQETLLRLTKLYQRILVTYQLGIQIQIQPHPTLNWMHNQWVRDAEHLDALTQNGTNLNCYVRLNSASGPIAQYVGDKYGSSTNTVQAWLDPSNPAVWLWVRSAIEAMLLAYPQIDGVYADNICASMRHMAKTQFFPAGTTFWSAYSGKQFTHQSFMEANAAMFNWIASTLTHPVAGKEAVVGGNLIEQDSATDWTLFKDCHYLLDEGPYGYPQVNSEWSASRCGHTIRQMRNFMALGPKKFVMAWAQSAGDPDEDLETDPGVFEQDTQHMRLGYAQALMAAPRENLVTVNGHTARRMTYRFTHYNKYGRQWFDYAEMFLDLGAALADAYEEVPGQWKRVYQNGYVRVNFNFEATNGVPARDALFVLTSTEPPPPGGPEQIQIRNHTSGMVSGSNSINIVLPEGALVDEVMHVEFTTRKPDQAVTITGPVPGDGSSLPVLIQEVEDDFTIGKYVFHYVVDADTPTHWVAKLPGVLTTTWTWRVFALQGVDPDAPVADFDNSNPEINHTELTLPSLDTSATEGCFVIASVGVAYTNNTITIDPVTADTMSHNLTLKAGGISITDAYFIEPGREAGPVGTRRFTFASARPVGSIVAYRPKLIEEPPAEVNLVISPELFAHESNNADERLFRIFLNLDVAGVDPVAINWTLTGASATIPGDVTGAASGTWTIPAGSGADGNFFVTLSAAQDATAEGNETFQLTITSVTGATLQGYPAGGWTLTIIDDEALSTTAAIAGYNPGQVVNGVVADLFNETAGSFTFAVELAQALAFATTVPFEVVSIGGAVAVTPPSHTLAFPAGSTQQFITLTITNDAVANPPRSITVKLKTSTGITQGSPHTINLTVIDDDSDVTPPVEIPSIPAELIALLHMNNTVQLLWQSDNNASEYDIQRGVREEGMIAAAVVYFDLELKYTDEPDRYHDETAQLGKVYLYRIRARNSAGVSEWSQPVEITMPGLPPMPVPTTWPSLGAQVVNTTQVQLTWTSVEHASDYQVRYSSNALEWTNLLAQPLLTLLHTPDTSTGIARWFYQVRGLNAKGEAGPWSDAVEAKLELQPAGTIIYKSQTRVWPLEAVEVREIITSVRGLLREFSGTLITDDTIFFYLKEAMRTAKNYFVEVYDMLYTLPQDEIQLPIQFYLPTRFQGRKPAAVRIERPEHSMLITRNNVQRERLTLTDVFFESARTEFHVLMQVPVEMPDAITDEVTVSEAWLTAATFIRVVPVLEDLLHAPGSRELDRQEQIQRAMAELQNRKAPRWNDDGTIQA